MRLELAGASLLARESVPAAGGFELDTAAALFLARAAVPADAAFEQAWAASACRSAELQPALVY